MTNVSIQSIGYLGILVARPRRAISYYPSPATRIFRNVTSILALVVLQSRSSALIVLLVTTPSTSTSLISLHRLKRRGSAVRYASSALIRDLGMGQPYTSATTR